MLKISVCKTRVPHPQQVEYLCLLANDIKKVANLKELADFISRCVGGFLVKNEAFGDVVSLMPDDALSCRFYECERLSPQEVHELATRLGW